ncbi:xanthine dehydrogenase family protein subunit M [Streptomyces sp. XM4193]|uniref:FAD binding domain-containing protein n=1 Tax=Streptomyces sp. XM4193 TaxID=2929782 RepID=UPI001FFB150E|nr:xanthine dehydrogenase family protein subunit M [Streptomyces sp. XM4193]MCK1795929.1 xanthine dehydrogenase family protein subunit M [Streptomyces sp. XM4193]
MKEFSYTRPDSAEAAVAAVAQDPDAVYLAGGTNLVDHLKLGVATPGSLVDVSRLPLDEVEPTPDGGLRIGATARNSDLAAHPYVRRHCPLLARALLAGASGQIRNVATTAGNLLQRTRCGYFQDPDARCNKRRPGAGCAAQEGWTRYHAILGTSEHCLAAHPSDMAVALAALDAVVVVQGREGERRVPLTHFHRLPDDRPDLETVLEHGELVTAVEVPPLPYADRSAYRKVRDRASYAFALVSVAAALDVRDGRVAGVRLALGGVGTVPWRASVAEEALVGGPATEEAYREALLAELAQASPREDNAFKIPMARSTAVSVLRQLTQDPSPAGRRDQP